MKEIRISTGCFDIEAFLNKTIEFLKDEVSPEDPNPALIWDLGPGGLEVDHVCLQVRNDALGNDPAALDDILSRNRLLGFPRLLFEYGLHPGRLETAAFDLER